MHVIIWEFRVPESNRAEFERIYSGDGDWAKLFQRKAGFFGTRLLRDENDAERYLTIDTWRDEQSFQAFKSEFRVEYSDLDRRCESLTVAERLVGRFSSDD